MGAHPSKLAPLIDFCDEQLKASQACMAQYDHDRERYWRPCRDTFLAYRECKRQWSDLKLQMNLQQARERHEAAKSQSTAEASTPPSQGYDAFFDQLGGPSEATSRDASPGSDDPTPPHVDAAADACSSRPRYGAETCSRPSDPHPSDASSPSIPSAAAL
ncbi:hypothetical protein CXG81DRAFT_20513 [Caulochytrium protostelioides]|uniref:CHCH domain-containing protein n=1 Tax=Caulochytrium protostelioides TaxID=1555241 RepID=A0A4P9X321_9FUNG|nr:hypothetical protein CXG81DRAFT_20513 [Caulochytrium protostelioides]|eukprot:RKO99401.1 hypothetical protein CXG81DRAFT_20513 [Caulochytrium protostelioides]